MQVEEILIIKNAKESYGISTNDISQISRVPLLMPLPLRPFGVRGLCAISGNVVTIVDMNLLLNMKEVEYHHDKTRLVVLNNSLATSTLLVSEVYNTVEINQTKIDYIEKDNDPVIAIYKYKNELIQVIDLNILFKKINKVEIESQDIKNGIVKLKSTKEEDFSRFLIFLMENEKYALNIDFLREIILADIDYTDISGSSDEVLGLITLRDELLIVIDLRKYYGFKVHYNYKNRILIAYHKGKKIGLLVDDILDIKNFPSNDIEYMKDELKNNKLAGVIHDVDSLISFFDSSVLEILFKENEKFIDAQKNVNQNNINENFIMEVIVFKLADKEYAFEIENIAEIIDIIESTKIVYTEAVIDGIINIRGQIVPIISLFKKLNIQTLVSADSKIIICEINEIKVGFIVDCVSDILHIKEDEIREQENELFSSILHLDNGNRLVLSIDINEMVAKKDI